MIHLHRILMPDEKVLKLAHLHWVFLGKGVFWLVVIAGGGFAADWYARIRWGVDLSPLDLLCAATGGVVFMTYLVLWLSVKIVLTNERLLYKRGIFTINFEEIGLDEIRGEHIHQGLIGNILNYGDVLFDCRLIDDLMIPGIAKPYLLTSAVVGARQKRTQNANGLFNEYKEKPEH